jgi:hypothetical protein
MGFSNAMQLRKSQTERYMGHKLSLFTNQHGIAWLSSDGVMSGPFDTLDEATRAMDRQKMLYKLVFYARTHRVQRTR